MSDKSARHDKSEHPNNAPGVPMRFPVWFENDPSLPPIARMAARRGVGVFVADVA